MTVAKEAFTTAPAASATQIQDSAYPRRWEVVVVMIGAAFLAAAAALLALPCTAVPEEEEVAEL
jgi:hypothetical protein